MIIFKELKIKNFLSVGNNEITVRLNDVASTLVVGQNGSGKSLVLDALSFTLFGKPHRAINKPQLINSINGKKCLTEIEFTIGNKDYRVIRGLKPNIFEIWVNGEMINQESHARDYQKILETNILKLNHKSFHQVVVLGSSNFIPFMQLPAYQRRLVIEDLLDIGIFSKMNSVLKIEQAKLNDQIRDVEYNYGLVNEKIAMQNKHIDKLLLISKENESALDDSIKDLREQTNVLISETDKLTIQYQEDYKTAQAAHDKSTSKYNRLNQYEQKIKDNIKSLQNESSFYANNEQCPSCHQDISDDIKEGNQHKCQSKIEELQDGLKSLKAEQELASTDVANTQSTLMDLMKINNQLSSNHALINNYQSRLSDLQEQKEQISDNEDVSTAKEELAGMKKRAEDLFFLKGDLSDSRYYNDLVAELLKDTGIKTKIINQYLPVMNKLINGYLNILDFFISFELDENFNETIRSRHRDDFSYSSFSEGEKSRINLALLFAWRQVAKMKNSTNTNLLILDEVFDSSLDSDGVENLLKIMKSLDPTTRIFVVTHKPESFENIFDRKITAHKKGNFTEYEYEMLKS